MGRILLLFCAVLAGGACSEDAGVNDTGATTITGFTPAAGGEGDAVIISGRNFKLKPYENIVKFGEISVSVESATADKLLVLLPGYLNECGETEVSVTIDGKTHTATEKFTIACPVIDSFDKSTADGGDLLAIEGSGFTENVSNVSVTIAGFACEVISTTTSTINARIPQSMLSGNHLVQVKIGNKIGVSTSLLRIRGPLITSVSPSTNNGCTQVTILGEDFSPILAENEVYIFGQTVQVLSASATALVVRPPGDIKQHGGQAVQVYVTSKGKTTASPGKILFQSTWQAAASLGTRGRYRGVAFSINEKGYAGLGGGVQSGTYELMVDFWEYNINTNTWTRKADFPGAAREQATAVSTGTRGYVGFGVGIDNIPMTDFWEYNPVNDSWQQMPAFPGVGRASAIGFSVNGKIYVGAGGYHELGDLWEFDPSSGNWTRKEDYPGAGTTGMISFAIGDKGYVGLGGLANDFWEYTPATNSWRARRDFPLSFMNNAVGLAVNGVGIAATGVVLSNGVGELTDQVWSYLPSTNEWIQLQGLQGAVRAQAVGFPIGNSYLIGTGVTSPSYQQTNDFYRYSCN